MRLVDEDDRVQRGPQPVVQRVDDLVEDFLFGVEVVVERAVREPGPLGDIGDASREEAVLFEDQLGRIEQPRAGADPLA